MFEIRIFEDKEYFVKIEFSNEIFFPQDEANRHYQEYLAWLAEGNEPEVMPEENYG